MGRVQIRITSTARRHKLSSARIREALTNAVFDHLDEDVAIYVGRDARGLVIELGIVMDDRGEGFAVLHAMPLDWRNR
jgi:hypothetical protein